MAKTAMSREVCMGFMNNGAEIAARAFREGRQSEARLCVEQAKRENGGYLDLASAGGCIIAATWR
jgi:hypothetical protein